MQNSPFFADLDPAEREIACSPICENTPTERDQSWLLETFKSLCDAAGQHWSYTEVCKQLQSRGFIDPPTPPVRTGSPFPQVYDTLEKIGEGGFGKVYHIHNLIDKQDYALKIVEVEPSEVKYAMREVQCLAALNSPRILRYYSSWIEETPESKTLAIFIQTELITGQPLSDILASRKSVNIDFSMKVFYQMTKALSEIHTAGIIHRDFTPFNVFVNSKGEIKVIDFGISSMKSIASFAPPPLSASAPGLTGSFQMRHQTLDEFCIDAASDPHPHSLREVGTPMYSSPRQMHGHKSTTKDDIYTFGIVVFELFSLFRTKMERSKAIIALRKSNTLPEEFEHQLPEIAKLIKSMTDPNRNQRPSAFDILNSPVFSHYYV